MPYSGIGSKSVDSKTVRQQGSCEVWVEGEGCGVERRARVLRWADRQRETVKDFERLMDIARLFIASYLFHTADIQQTDTRSQ